ncbi:MAG TPA: NIPSNAP family protein [Rhizobium sp.]|nr:NIPSNAP family protein [Rhizobium sp.]
MIYEQRVYSAIPGRLPDLLTRFREHTLGIWKRLGIEPAGFWTTAIGPDSNQLTYFLKWESLAEREAKWSSFVTDDEWLAVRAASEANGPIVERIASSLLSPTDFSSVQ